MHTWAVMGNGMINFLISTFTLTYQRIKQDRYLLIGFALSCVRYTTHDTRRSIHNTYTTHIFFFPFPFPCLSFSIKERKRPRTPRSLCVRTKNEQTNAPKIKNPLCRNDFYSLGTPSKTGGTVDAIDCPRSSQRPP